MDIIFIRQHFALPTEAGGGRPWEFSRRLVRAGHNVTVIAGGDASETMILEGVRIIRLRARYRNSMGWARRVTAFIAFALRGTWAALRTPGDLVFASSTPLTTAIPGLITSFVRRLPFVFEVRDLWPSVPIELGHLSNPILIRASRLLEKLSYARARDVIALSPGMARGVKQVRPDARVTVVPNACDFELFAQGRANRQRTRSEMGWEGDLILMYAGSFGLSYRLEWLVDLASLLRGHGVRVVAFGHGTSTQALWDRSRKHGLDPSSILMGKVPKLEVARLLPAADIVVSSLDDHPSLHVNSLNKVFDAMAAGRPVLFNHGGWLSEELSSRGAGWFEPDAVAAADLVKRLAKDEQAVERAGLASDKLGRERFSRDHLYKEFERTLLHASSGRALKP